MFYFPGFLVSKKFTQKSGTQGSPKLVAVLDPKSQKSKKIPTDPCIHVYM